MKFLYSPGCDMTVRSKRWQFLSFGVLLILPKCSLCLFALSSSIAICGLEPRQTPFWEYLLIVILCFPMLMFHKEGCPWKLKGRMLLLIVGVLNISTYMIWPHTYGAGYTVGLCLLASGLLYPLISSVWTWTQPHLGLLGKQHVHHENLQRLPPHED